MKKKAIERIPYLGLKKASRKKDVKYIGVTAVRIVGHEKHLFLEMYRNAKNQTEPVVRIVLNKRDFGTYLPESGEWTRQKIKADSRGGKLIWLTHEDYRSDWQHLEKKNILQSGEDLKRLKEFCKTTTWNEDRWWDYVMKFQDDITFTARRRIEERRYKRRQEALNDRIRHTKVLPEQRILKMANDVYFHNQHYLYYKKHGSWVQVACSKCGGVTDARWKEGVSYESQFQRHIEEPREGQTGTCPLCGERGNYKCQGKVKGAHSRKIHLFLGQKYKEKGMVIRYLDVTKEWCLELIAGENGDEMHGAYEKISGLEIARTYFFPGEKTQTDYHKHSWYSGKDFWDDCNLYGNANITIGEAWILPETFQEMQGTMFQYSGLKEFAAAVGEMNPIDYLERYQQTPQIEMLTKMGLTEVVKELVGCRYGIVADQYAKCPDKFLGIRKERVKQLIAKKGDIRMLKVMQAEKRLNQIWTESQIKRMSEIQMEAGQIAMVTKYMGLQKFLNHIEKYAGCQFGTGCSGAEGRLKSTADTYMDYLSMRLDQGYDLNNTVYQYPRDLRAAHDEMVYLINKEKLDKRMEEVKWKYPNIQQNYKKLREKYYFEDDEYLIRPARSAGEIVEEGRILHHCVGGNSYLRKHNNGESYILMLRFKDMPERPYITMEIEGEKASIRQWYGDKDRKPDQKNMQKWLDNYLKYLKEEQRVLAQAV